MATSVAIPVPSWPPLSSFACASPSGPSPTNWSPGFPYRKPQGPIQLVAILESCFQRSHQIVVHPLPARQRAYGYTVQYSLCRSDAQIPSVGFPPDNLHAALQPGSSTVPVYTPILRSSRTISQHVVDLVSIHGLPLRRLSRVYQLPKMMVPRAYVHTSMQKHRQDNVDEKTPLRQKGSIQETRSSLRRPASAQDLTQVTIDSRLQRPSLPVRIPSQKLKRPNPAPFQTSLSSPSPSISSSSNKRKSTPQDILFSTAIPVRRRPKGRPSQRLPNCDHVSSFSKLLLDDVSSKNETSPSASLSSAQYDGLFGNIDQLVEEQMFVGSEGVDSSILSPRSISSESMASLASPDDFLSSDIASTPLSEKKSLSVSRLRQVASSEEAGSSHPLLAPGKDSEEQLLSRSDSPSLSLKPKRRPVPPKTSSSFKSSLSASLRALKSAADSISINLATTTASSVQPDDFAIFWVQPSLTDDKRPLPSSKPPSSALRRYLNPQTHSLPAESPQHLHFWHEDRPSTAAIPSSTSTGSKSKKKSKRGIKDSTHLPPTVQLQFCIPPAVRTAHASSPPIWLAPDGQPTNKNTAHYGANGGILPFEPGQPRQREPRENRDFLRVLVAEMNMRRAGKLEATVLPYGDKPSGGSGENGGSITTSTTAAGTKAALWLPPVKEDFGGRKDAIRLPPELRWRAWGVDDVV